jgi:hypothetical protein
MTKMMDNKESSKVLERGTPEFGVKGLGNSTTY